jgi:UDP-N-acetylenolpyruvoylglucosamine reductase
MNWYSGLESFVRRDEPLAERTTFAIGGRAAFFMEPAT